MWRIFTPAKLAHFHSAVDNGDTIKVLVNNKEVKVRLWGIDCPEKKQAFGTEAKKATSELCFNKVVKVTVTGKDRDKRSIGIVELPNGNILNQELVRQGMA